VVAVLIVTAALATQVRHVRLEIRRRALEPQQHPYVQIHNRITELFGGGTIAIAGVIANQGDIYTPEVLGKIYRITQGLRHAPGVIEANLFSIAAPYVKAVVTGPDGTMEVHPLMEAPPTTPEQIRALRDTIRQDKLFRGNLVSADETAAVIVVDFDDTRVNDVAIMQSCEKVLAPERDASVTIAVVGVPILRAWLGRYTRMIGVLFPIAVVVIGFVHYDAFRTAQAVFLPLTTALLSVVWALGIMGLVGRPMDTWSAMTPVVILAVGAGHAVQILKRYYEEYALVGDSQQAVIRAVTAVGPVMLTAGLIASAGFGSLMSFGITSVRVFGLLLASGILSALVIELTFTPACRCLLPPPRKRELRREEAVRWLDRALEGLAVGVTRWPRSVLACALLTALLALAGASAVQVDNSLRFWFAPSTQVRKDDALLNEKLAGTSTLRILVDGDRDNVLQEPRVLEAIDDLERFMETDDHIGGVTSIADHVKRMHQAMNGGDPTFYAIPDNARLIAQYLLLYDMAAGPDGLSAFVDGTYRRAVIRALSKSDGVAFSRMLLTRLRDFAAARFRGLPARVDIAGRARVLTAMNEVVVRERSSTCCRSRSSSSCCPPSSCARWSAQPSS
jgi:predicted RND superfamily exporter protein